MTEENAEHWERALAKFESVQAIKASPAVRFHIALCEEKLGRLAAALSDYEAARVSARAEGSKEVLATVDEPIARLSAEVPHVTLTGDPPPSGTSIEIDGRNLSNVGFGVPIPLDPGAHKIVVTTPGRRPFTHSVVLTTKADVGVRVIFETDPAPAAQPDLAPPKTPVQRHPERPWAIATTAAAVVFVGAGVGMILGAGSVRSSNEGTCPSADDCGTRTTVRALDWGGASGLLVGAGFAAASIVLWTRPARTTTTTTVGVRAGQLVVGGTFQ